MKYKISKAYRKSDVLFYANVCLYFTQINSNLTERYKKYYIYNKTEFDLTDVFAYRIPGNFISLIVVKGQVSVNGGGLYLFSGFTDCVALTLKQLSEPSFAVPKVILEDNKLFVEPYDNNGCYVAIVNLI